MPSSVGVCVEVGKGVAVKLLCRGWADRGGVCRQFFRCGQRRRFGGDRTAGGRRGRTRFGCERGGGLECCRQGQVKGQGIAEYEQQPRGDQDECQGNYGVKPFRGAATTVFRHDIIIYEVGNGRVRNGLAWNFPSVRYDHIAAFGFRPI